MGWFDQFSSIMGSPAQVGRGGAVDRQPAVAERGSTLQSLATPMTSPAQTAMPAPAGIQARDAYDQQIIDAVTRANGGNPDPRFLQEQLDYYRGKRFSGEPMGNNLPADDNYWIGRAGEALDPAHDVGGSSFAPGGGYSLTGANGLSSFSAPGLAAPYTQEFRYDPSQIVNSPAYQFRLQQGEESLGRAAAARGTDMSGGFLKDLATFSQGLASTEYDKDWNRAFDVDARNMGVYYKNQDNAFSRLSSLANTGQNAASSYAANTAPLYQQGGNLNAANTAAQNAINGGMTGNLAQLGVNLATDVLARRKAKPATTPQTQPLYSGDVFRAPTVA